MAIFSSQILVFRFVGRGHGHSDSSRSPTRTPIIAEKKAEPKKRRKNNEAVLDFVSFFLCCLLQC